MHKTTPQESYDLVIGALPQVNLWWVTWKDSTESDPTAWTDNWQAPDDWKITGTVWDPCYPEAEGQAVVKFELNHELVMRAARAICAKAAEWDRDTFNACVDLIHEPEECDFDSYSADLVCQMAVLGEPYYG